jgi:hypothetical protein
MPTSHPTIGARPAKSPDAPVAVSSTTATPTTIPLLHLLQKPTPVFCRGNGHLAIDDLAELIELLFGDNGYSDEFKAAALLRFIIKLEAVINRADPREMNDLDSMFVRGQVKLFPLTLFFSNALSAFQTTCLPDSVLEWSEGSGNERNEQQARLNVRNGRFELVPVTATSQPAQGGAQQ